MGNKASSRAHPKTKDYIDPRLPIDIYALKKRRPGCTGMFWREDPKGRVELENNRHWPRDGAVLQGQIVTAKGQKWLAATHVKQARGNWVEAPYGSYIPLEYNNHYYLEKTAKYLPQPIH